jgi:alkanesulfonate monooxygenase SsuD/methylene tetrahydromethanopterin reductase-like flavin-dependent oxidoreductase (luciferase family)
VRIATLVAQIPLRNPVLFALQALTADHICGGRVEVGIGTGLPIDPSYRMMGIENWSNAERVARLREYVELVARLMAGEEVTYAGRFYSADRARLQPGPVQTPRPPLMIAAMGKVMLGIAARHADIWNSLSFAKTFAEQMAETRERIAFIGECCAAIGRDPATLRRSYLMFDPSARGSGGRLSYYESESAFEDTVSAVLALGITEVALYYPMLERQAPMLERIAYETIPRLRRTASGSSPNP